MYGTHEAPRAFVQQIPISVLFSESTSWNASFLSGEGSSPGIHPRAKRAESRGTGLEGDEMLTRDRRLSSHRDQAASRSVTWGR